MLYVDQTGESFNTLSRFFTGNKKPRIYRGFYVLMQESF